MKFCSKCGKELLDEAVICPGCGCAVANTTIQSTASVDSAALLNTLSTRVKTSGIIWLVIGILQIILGIFVNWFLLIVGALNIISSVQDMNYSKKVMDCPDDIVKKFEPLTGPIITLIYNLIFGGVIGVVGSIYYFVGIRSFVMENKTAFSQMGQPTTN